MISVATTRVPDPLSCGAGSGTFVFTSNECLSPPAPMSPPNVVTLCDANTCSDINEPAHGAIIARFNSPADGVCIQFAPVMPEGQGILRAYDAAHNELTAVIGSSTLCVSASGIKSVEFSGYLADFGWFDNLRVSYEVVGVESSAWSGVKARSE